MALNIEELIKLRNYLTSLIDDEAVLAELTRRGETA